MTKKPATQKEIVKFFLTGHFQPDTALVSLACHFAGQSYDKIIKRLHKEATRVLAGKSCDLVDYVDPAAVSYFSDDSHLDHGED